MPRYKTVHFCALDKFIPPFIEFIDEHIDNKNQIYFLFGDIKKYPVPLSDRVILMNGILVWFKLIYHSFIAQKIVLHSLLRKSYVIFIFLQQWLLSKKY